MLHTLICESCKDIFMGNSSSSRCPRCGAMGESESPGGWSAPGIRDSALRAWSEIFVRSRSRVGSKASQGATRAASETAYPSETQNRTEDNIRQSIRYEYRELFELVANSKKQLVCSVNISRSGIFVETNAPLELGARVTLIAQALHRGKPREIRCIVRWTKPNSGAGLEFEELKTSDALWLNQIISDI